LLVDSGRKTVAAVAIVERIEGGLIVGRVQSGSLERERRLERLRVRLVRRALPAPASLRVGMPSAARAALRFGCGAWTLRSPAVASYRIEPAGRLAFRMTREGSRDSLAAAASAADGRAAAIWPDTLHVSLFDDAADEEIALERGDLDVALFGPGELSARLRNDPRWQNRLFADGGALADASADSSGTPATMAAPAPFPVLTPPDLMPYVRALGPSYLLGMLDCAPARRGAP
ncbi:MAG TPA: hypothetical protein VFU59_04525, partial [Candidatus Eisenbacteria bacterium]|nr:hypothetical protein [Candidatus Eisenbacteria bacterium]